MQPEVQQFPKIPRLSRDIIITEKIDGTNAQIYITDEGEIYAGSRTRWITPQADNYGFARWVEGNKQTLLTELGPGQHFGEWWGVGIQRGYGLKEKKFSLFNTSRWKEAPLTICSMVPELYQGPFETSAISFVLNELSRSGSRAAPGFMSPEGIVIFHTASQGCFKKTIEKNESPKGI